MTDSGNKVPRTYPMLFGVPCPTFSYPTFLEKDTHQKDFQQVVNFGQLGANAILREKNGGDEKGMIHFLKDAGASLRRLRERLPDEAKALEDAVMNLMKALVQDFNEREGTTFDVEAVARELTDQMSAGAFWSNPKPAAKDVKRLIGQHRDNLPDYLL